MSFSMGFSLENSFSTALFFSCVNGTKIATLLLCFSVFVSFIAKNCFFASFELWHSPCYACFVSQLYSIHLWLCKVSALNANIHIFHSLYLLLLLLYIVQSFGTFSFLFSPFWRYSFYPPTRSWCPICILKFLNCICRLVGVQCVRAFEL